MTTATPAGVCCCDTPPTTDPGGQPGGGGSTWPLCPPVSGTRIVSVTGVPPTFGLNWFPTPSVCQAALGVPQQFPETSMDSIQCAPAPSGAGWVGVSADVPVTPNEVAWRLFAPPDAFDFTPCTLGPMQPYGIASAGVVCNGAVEGQPGMFYWLVSVSWSSVGFVFPPNPPPCFGGIQSASGSFIAPGPHGSCYVGIGPPGDPYSCIFLASVS